MKTNFQLSATDHQAITNNDSNYLLNKGAMYYNQGQFDLSVSYYKIAASMGNIQAVANLGYCYLYGRSVSIDVQMSLAYFKIASLKGNIDACYKLGHLYSSDKWQTKDIELSNYYYQQAANLLLDDDLISDRSIVWQEQLQDYPSLCYALGVQHSESGNMELDIELSYQFLKHAQLGYEKELSKGNRLYEKAYHSLIKLIAEKQYNEVREEYDAIFDDQ